MWPVPYDVSFAVILVKTPKIGENGVKWPKITKITLFDPFLTHAHFFSKIGPEPEKYLRFLKNSFEYCLATENWSKKRPFWAIWRRVQVRERPSESV